ncbi:hypothetical protein SNEBB_009965 [Seison nebaliae]|nr:hypothetical protein SNEBB_009965 [Seison nebaliae]
MSAIFNFESLITVIILMICTCAYVKNLFPTLVPRTTGLRGLFWKFARVGERKSLWISGILIILSGRSFVELFI